MFGSGLRNGGVFLAVVAGLIVLHAGAAHANDDTAAKLKARVAELSSGQQAALLLLLSEMTKVESTSGQTAAETPEIAVKSTLDQFNAMLAGKSFDIEKFLSRLSDDFSHPVVGDKEGATAWLKNAIDMVSDAGVPDLKFSTEDAEFEIEGDEVEIYPVDLETPLGDFTLTIYGKKEADGIWRVVEIEGL